MFNSSFISLQFTLIGRVWFERKRHLHRFILRGNMAMVLFSSVFSCEWIGERNFNFRSQLLAQFLLYFDVNDCNRMQDFHLRQMLNQVCMKTKISILVVTLFLASCASSPFGSKVKEPFRGNAYESNNRFFRATGKGVSTADNIARSKADIEAKAMMASQVNTTIKEVTDQYLGQTQNERAGDLADKFQSLVREVMSTDLSDLRKIGEEKYYNAKEKKYTVFIAYEIKKKAMFKFMKEQSKVNSTINEQQKNTIQKIIDEELKKASDDDNE